jgi:large subunit ribosomal protein L21
MTFAIVDIAGFQEKVSEGMTLRVPLLKEKKEGEVVTFDQVLLLSKGEKNMQVGSPYVKGATVEGKILGFGRGEKMHIFKMKHRKRYRRTQGHRQFFTDIEVTKVSG